MGVLVKILRPFLLLPQFQRNSPKVQELFFEIKEKYNQGLQPHWGLHYDKSNFGLSCGPLLGTAGKAGLGKEDKVSDHDDWYTIY